MNSISYGTPPVAVPVRIVAGVPLGSIRGPLRFNIFINDIFVFIDNSDLYSYAGNSTTFASAKYLSLIMENLNHTWLNHTWNLVTYNDTRIKCSKVLDVKIVDKLFNAFSYKQRFIPTQPQSSLTFSWIELQMLLRCYGAPLWQNVLKKFAITFQIFVSTF